MWFLYYFLVTRLVLAVAFVGYVRYCRKCQRECVPAYHLWWGRDASPWEAIDDAQGLFFMMAIFPSMFEFFGACVLFRYVNYRLVARSGLTMGDRINLWLLGASEKPKV
jgi:hypothetical protein